MNLPRRVLSATTALLLTIGLLPVAQSQDKISESTSLGEAIAFAQKHNAAIAAANSRWQAAIQRVPQAKGWPDPRLTYGYFIETVETRVGPQEQRVGVMQPLPWFGKLKAAGDVASTDAAAALATAVPVIDGIVNKGIMHKNKASRHKSRLNAKVRALGA